MTLSKALLIAVMASAILAPAFAQNAPIASARATIETISADGDSLGVKTRAGEERTIHISPKTRFALVVPATLADVKAGTFVGVAAAPGDGGELKAMEVHIFPDAMRGTGEGSRPFDLAPGSSMTNGAITARVDAASGPRLTVTYKGGEQTIVVDSNTAIVAIAPGAQTDLRPGAAIIARGPKQDDGSIDAAYVAVGKDGLVPPM
jgi:glucose/arabinose dehydrogenase